MQQNWTISLRWSEARIANSLPAVVSGPLRIVPADSPEAGRLPHYGFAVFFGNELLGTVGSNGFMSALLLNDNLTIDERREIEERAKADLEEAKDFAAGAVTHAAFRLLKGIPTPRRSSARRDEKGRFVSNA